MKYEAITPVQVILSGGENEIYMITRVTGELTLDEIRNATGFVVPIEELPEPVPVEAPEQTEEPARRKSSVDHDRIMELAAAGYPPKEIAEQIGCSEQTVRNHIARENPR